MTAKPETQNEVEEDIIGGLRILARVIARATANNRFTERGSDSKGQLTESPSNQDSSIKEVSSEQGF
jgi:hypothetical protein